MASKRKTTKRSRVSSYTRTTPSGKKVRVKSYTRRSN